MAKRYIIRLFSFAYNDEYYMNCGDMSKVISVFYDYESAKKELIKLTALFFKQEELYNYEPFVEPEKELLNNINEFCIKCCGEGISGDDCYFEMPENLNDDQLYQISLISEFHPYKLIELNDNDKFFALWLNGEEKYIGNYNLNMIYHQNIEDFYEEISYEIINHLEDKLHGTYDQLSDSPLLMKNFILSKSYFDNDELMNTFSLNCSPYSIPAVDLFAINELLKNKIFEVHSLTLEEVMNLDK